MVDVDWSEFHPVLQVAHDALCEGERVMIVSADFDLRARLRRQRHQLMTFLVDWTWAKAPGVRRPDGYWNTSIYTFVLDADE